MFQALSDLTTRAWPLLPGSRAVLFVAAKLPEEARNLPMAEIIDGTGKSGASTRPR